MANLPGVLFIQSQSLFGADSAVHAELMRHLDRSAFAIHVACTVGDGPEKPPSLRVIEGIPNVRLRPTRFIPGVRSRTAAGVVRGILSGTRFPLDFAGLKTYIEREGIRILHSTERPRDAIYCAALGRLTGAKSVVHVHVKWSDEHSALSRYGVRYSDAALGVSQYVSDTIVATGKPRNQVHTVLNAIDVTRWDPTLDGSGVRREFSVPDDAPLLVSVSRLFSWKGQRELVRALAMVRQEVPDVRLLVVGADETFVHGGSFTQELREIAREVGVLDRVTFTGQRSDIPQMMAACDLFTMPSFEEPFGLVFLEAMAMQKPVIAVANGGTPEVVQHGTTGLLSGPWDVPGLAQNIVTLLKAGERRRAMGRAARERVLERFTVQRMARDVGALYEQILGA